MKKTLSIALVLMMVLALALTGCGGNSNTTTTAAAAGTTAAAQKTTAAAADKTTAAAAPADELVTIDWYAGDGMLNEKRGYQSWIDWMNGYLAESINTNVAYHGVAYSDYEQKVVAVMSAGQPLDVMLTSVSRMPFATWQAADAFAPLDDLMAEYAQETLAIVPSYVWDAARVNGVLYAMPTYKDMTTFGPLFYNETVVENAGQLEKLQNLEWYTIYDYIDIVYDTKEYRDSQKPELAKMPIMSGNNWDHLFYAYDQITSLAYTAIPGTNGFVEDGYDAGETVFNKYATKEYEKKALMIKQLVDDYVMPYDWSNLGDDAKTWTQDQIYCFSVGWGDCSVDREKYLEEYGFLRNISMPKLSFTGTSYIQAVMQAISSTSTKQVNAMKFLNALYSDPMVSTSWHFGTPEEAWKLVEKDGVQRVDFTGTTNEDKSDRAFHLWYHAEAGNLFTTYLPLENPDNFYEVLDYMNSNSQTSANMGFMVDSEPITNEIAAVSGVISEYDNQLMQGMLPDIAPILNTFLEKLNANGAEKIVTEVQAQLDAWKSAQ